MPNLFGFLGRPIVPILLLCASTAQAVALNDTGIDFCGDATTNTANCATVAVDGGTFPRQDARYGRDAQAAAGTLIKIGLGSRGFDYTKIANDGSELSASAAFGSGAKDWACTRDNVTGLIWEVKTTSGMRSKDHTYSWYNSNPATNGSDSGTSSGGTCFMADHCDTEKFATDVNAARLCGAADWRMPSKKELEGLVDYGRSNPSIAPTYFPNTPSSEFWSGSFYAPLSGAGAWDVDFSSGYANRQSKSSKYAVRLVRSGQ